MLIDPMMSAMGMFRQNENLETNRTAKVMWTVRVPPTYSKQMKRVVLKAVLVALLTLELYLFTGFLRMRWQVAINDAIPRILPPTHDYSIVSHPAINQEIELAMKEHIALRMTVWAVFGGVLVVNTFLIRWVYRLRRSSKRSP